MKGGQRKMNDTEENKEETSTEFQNPDLPIVQGGELPDMEQFEGKRAKIEGWDIVEVNSYYNEAGERIATPILVKCLKVFSEKLGEGTKSDGTVFDLRATVLFNLKKDKDGKLGLSSHPRSNIQKFFKKLKVNNLAEIKGKFVTIVVDDSGWLRFAY